MCVREKRKKEYVLPNVIDTHAITCTFNTCGYTYMYTF